MKITRIPRVERSRYGSYDGLNDESRSVDYSVDRYVVTRVMQSGSVILELQWLRGFTGWSGVGCTKYYPASMHLARPGNNLPESLRLEANRLGLKMMAEVIKKVKLLDTFKPNDLYQKGMTTVITLEKATD